MTDDVCPECGAAPPTSDYPHAQHAPDCEHALEVDRPLMWHPDPWMDNEPGPTTFPEHWGSYGPPPHQVTLGPVEASWEEIDPGVALIKCLGGTVADRTLVHDLLRVRLAAHGIEQAQFSIGEDDEFRKTAHWRDLMAKAKRLIDSGQVQLLNNSANVVAGHVIGDHGEYNCEFNRDDPQSWSITMWNCECPWSQYAWQRTRKWKKYEGRVCSHVLGLFWFARRHPLDEDISPSGPNLPPGMKGFEPSPAPAPEGVPAPEGPPGAAQQQFGVQPGFGLQDNGPGQFSAPVPAPDSAGMPPMMGPDAALPGAQPGAPGLIPPQPMLPAALPPYIPGSTPNGMAAPPNAYSVPGMRPQSPANPTQYPGDGTGTGGTFSKVAASEFVNGAKVKLLNAEWGIAEGKSDAHGAGEYRQVNQGTSGEVMSQDATTGWVEVIFPLPTSGPMEPYHVRSFIEPKNLQIIGHPPGSPFIKRVGPHTSASERLPIATCTNLGFWLGWLEGYGWYTAYFRNDRTYTQAAQRLGVHFTRGFRGDQQRMSAYVNGYNRAKAQGLVPNFRLGEEGQAQADPAYEYWSQQDDPESQARDTMIWMESLVADDHLEGFQQDYSPGDTTFPEEWNK